MPIKLSENSFNPRIVRRTTKPHTAVYYIEHWPDKTTKDKRKFHRCHDGVCTCGKPKPNRPCPHYDAALEVLKTFEHKTQDKALDASIEYMVLEWHKSDHSGRKPKTVELYMGSYKIFKCWCEAQGITHSSQLKESHQRSPLADFKMFLTTVPYSEAQHTPESKKIKRHIDYLVRRDKITRESPEYQDPKYQDEVRKMKALMVAEERMYAAHTVHRVFRDLRVLLQFCRWRKMMTDNPLDEAGKPRSQRIVTPIPADQKERNPLTLAERERILEKTTGDTRDMAIVYLYTGMRLDELANLHWQAHVRSDRIYMCPVNGWEPKWGRSRTIPMHPLVKEVVERQRTKHPKAEYVFNTTGHTRGSRAGELVPYDKRRLQDKFKRVFDKLKIVGEEGNGVSIHCFRHTFITMLLLAGESILRVRDIAGHKDIRTTMKYAHRVESQGSTVLATLR